MVEPIERHVDWMADAVAIRFKSDRTRGVGTEFFCDTKVGPIKLVDEMTITSWEPNACMGVSHSGIVTGSGEFTLSIIDDERTPRCADSDDALWQEFLPLLRRDLRSQIFLQ